MISFKITLIITYLLQSGVQLGPQFIYAQVSVANENAAYWTPQMQACLRMVEALEERRKNNRPLNPNAFGETYECIVQRL